MAPAAQAPRPRRDDRRPRGVRQHERRRQQINAVRDELIRRGLPVRRAVRYARELQAHWEDLRDELQASGATPATAEAGADVRLGTTQALVAAAVKAHRQERFSGRHPIVAFVLVPFALVPILPVLLLLVLLPLALVFGLMVSDNNGDEQPEPPAAMTPQESQSARQLIHVTYTVFYAWAYGMPAVLTAVIHRRARRRTLSSFWSWTASAALAVSAGLQKLNQLRRPGGRPGLAFSFGGWPTPSIVIAVLASAALAAWMIRRGARRATGHEGILMQHSRRLASLILCASAVTCLGCAGGGSTRVSTERLTGASSARPADRLVVVMRVEPDGFWDGKDRKNLSDQIGRSVRSVSHTTIIDFAASNPSGDAGGRAADQEALRVAREQGADRACVVDVRACFTRLMVPLLPPGWELENRLIYSVRTFDVATGERVFSRTRSRKDGGFYVVHLPDLQKYFDQRLREDLVAATGTPSASQ